MYNQITMYVTGVDNPTNIYYSEYQQSVLHVVDKQRFGPRLPPVDKISSNTFSLLLSILTLYVYSKWFFLR